MGFLSRRLKKQRRGRNLSRPGRSDSSRAEDNPIANALHIIAFLLFYIVWSSFTFPQSSGWKHDLRLTIENKLGLKPQQQHTPSNGGTTTTTASIQEAAAGHQTHRIPCGLIVVMDGDTTIDSEHEEENVLPLATSAVVPTATTSSATSSASASATSSATSTDTSFQAVSTLHARALEKYPVLLRYVVVPSSENDVPPKKKTKNNHRFQRMIPSGTFRLRMGSEESTIEESPPLWIVESGSDTQEHQHDLVLGTAFWEDHEAEFGSDEVYVFPSSLSSSETDTDKREDSSSSSSSSSSPRVMVPYLRMRPRPSFGTDDL